MVLEPDHLRVAELRRRAGEDGVPRESGEGVPSVDGVRDILNLSCGRVQSIDRNDAVVLIGEEA